jgi:predicted NAD-dependent protein-ADP-ribosyltransferase YbiA (DUF1768 family)
MKEMKMNVVKIGKKKEDWGWMGNMGKCKLFYDGREWESSEGIFIGMRFEDEGLVEMLRKVDNGGMMVKMVSKKYLNKMVVERCSEEDVENMRKVLKLKVKSYGWMRKKILESGKRFIFEDVGKRKNNGNSMFWGGYFDGGVIEVNGKICGLGEFKGKNVLGKLWMELREDMRNEMK